MSAASSQQDRRRRLRIPLAAVVRYAPRQLAASVPHELWEGLLINISQSGALMRLQHRLGLQGLVELTFIQASPPRCVSIVGKVVRCEIQPATERKDYAGTIALDHLVAVEFTRSLDPEEIALLRERSSLDATVAESRRANRTPP